MKINVSIQETKFIAWSSSRAQIPFAYRYVMRYAVFTRVKYATTPRNCWTCYPPRYSNGWAEFWSEPMKLLVNKLNHAHWLRMSNRSQCVHMFLNRMHHPMSYPIRLNCQSKSVLDWVFIFSIYNTLAFPWNITIHFGLFKCKHKIFITFIAHIIIQHLTHPAVFCWNYNYCF